MVHHQAGRHAGIRGDRAQAGIEAVPAEPCDRGLADARGGTAACRVHCLRRTHTATLNSRSTEGNSGARKQVAKKARTPRRHVVTGDEAAGRPGEGATDRRAPQTDGAWRPACATDRWRTPRRAWPLVRAPPRAADALLSRPREARFPGAGVQPGRVRAGAGTRRAVRLPRGTAPPAAVPGARSKWGRGQSRTAVAGDAVHPADQLGGGLSSRSHETFEEPRGVRYRGADEPRHGGCQYRGRKAQSSEARGGQQDASGDLRRGAGECDRAAE